MNKNPNPATRFKPGRAPAQRRKPGDYAQGRLKVESVLSPEDRVAYHALLRNPATSVRSARRWLRERGYGKEVLGTTAIRNHARSFRARLDAIRDAAEMSAACADIAREVGGPLILDGAVTRFETLLTQALIGKRDGAGLDSAEWSMLGKALNEAGRGRGRVEDIRAAVDETKRRAADAAQRAADAGADGKTVVERVREILGM